MKSTYLLTFFLAPVINFAHPLTEERGESPVESRDATAPTRPTQSPNPLPDETDGVHPNGTIVNSTPNIDILIDSCWTEPNKQFVDNTGPAYEDGTRQMCMIQGGLGTDSRYEAWVRDANNTAVGDMPAIYLGPGTTVGSTWSLWAAEDSVTMHVTPNKSPSFASAVTMMWGYETDPNPLMYFNAATKMDSTNCAFANDNEDSSMIYFQCHFHCGIPLDFDS